MVTPRTNIVELPDFKIASDIPDIKLKSFRIERVKVFEDYLFDFSEQAECKPFVCFFGPNGTGKTTALNCIQMIFSRFEGFKEDRLKAFLGKSVRHVSEGQSGIYTDDDFLITANIKSSLGDYEVQINKKGFIKDHPDEIKLIIYRLFFYARFDQELHQFHLPRNKWGVFKGLFEGVTGFEIEEKTTLFDQSDDPAQADMLRNHVLGFLVHKPDETIDHTECSAGERKVIKCFSTLLDKECPPSVICIDNIEAHVEAGRHLQLVESMKKCLPNSQIFATTHSYQISRNFGDRSQLYDLRLIKYPFKNEPWRLVLTDEINDCISRIKSTKIDQRKKDDEIKEGKILISRCFELENNNALVRDVERFMKRNVGLFLSDLIS